MADERRREAWQHTSQLLAMLVNCHRDPKRSSAARPKDFDPYARERDRVVRKASVDVLKDVFINKDKRCRDVRKGRD